jgi:DNA-binding XRE family transcriptional regulator
VKLKMDQWAEIKKTITSIPDTEKKYLENLSELVVKIIERRKELNLSQLELAEISGLKQPAIARLENARSIPRMDTVIRLGLALGIKLKFVEYKIED